MKITKIFVLIFLRRHRFLLRNLLRILLMILILFNSVLQEKKLNM